MSKESKANNSVVEAEKDKQGMSRRKVIGSLAVVGGVSAMPTSWVKPVINSVILPAHAQTSAEPTPGLFLSTVNIQAENGFGDSPAFTVDAVGPGFSGGGVFIASGNLMADVSIFDNSVFIMSDGIMQANLFASDAILSAGSSQTSLTQTDSAGNNFTLTFTNTGNGTLDVALTLL